MGVAQLHPVERMPDRPDVCIICWRAWVQRQATRRAQRLATLS